MARTHAPRAVATVLAFAGCSGGEQRREVDVPPLRAAAPAEPGDDRTIEAPRPGGPQSSVALPGTWTPLPGRIVDVAATDDMLFLAEVPDAGHPMRVHAGRWRDRQWRWETPWIVPWPPTVAAGHDLAGSGASLDVEARPGGAHVTLSRIEYQGGSHGIALTTLANGTWSPAQELASPTDADIAFGTPALRRGDALLTSECHGDRLWHYSRAGTQWHGRPIALPAGGTLLCEPAMDVDATGGELVAVYQDAAAKPSLALYRRESTESYTLAGTRALPGPVNALVFAGAELYVGFQRPAADGATVWALGPELPEPLVPVRRFELPAPVEPKQEHLSGLDVSARWILAQGDAPWVLDAAASGSRRRLELPPAAGKRTRPTGVLMGSVAVILLEDQLGAFALE